MDILTPSGCGIHNFESAPCSTSKETKDQIEKGCKDLEFVTFANEQKKEDMLIDKGLLTFSRKEKRKNLKKIKRKEKRKELAEKVRADELIRLQDPEEQAKLYLQEQAEAEAIEMEKKEREEQEKLWLEREQKAMQEVAQREEAAVRERECRKVVEDEEEEGYEYVEDGPAEIIWEGNEITLKKKKVKVKKNQDVNMDKDIERPTSNPLPPQSAVFATPSNPVSSLYEALEQIPNFGTEQDKTHCPFHIKTGACRFGIRCSRAHVYPEKSCTLLLKNMYNGPGLLWEHDEGLESTDEEVAEKYEEFYEDVHSEFLKFGELINFKVCRNGSAHLRGNVYVHYREEESAIEAQRYMNARFFGGKQITCEFVGVTRWKIAICGEYMKAHHQVCSHGTACNFLHCFRNPGGEYDWADWDAPPPRSWKLKMANLFGYKVEYVNQHDDRRKGDQQENGRNKGGSSFQSHHSHYTKRDNGIRRSKPQRTSWGYAELDEKYNSSRDDKEEAHRKTSRRRNYDLYGNGATYSDSDNEKERIERRRKQKRASASSISKRPESNVSRYSDSDNEKGWHRESKGTRKRSKTPHSSSESASEDGKDDHKDTKHNSNSREMRVSKRRPEELHKQKQSKSQKYRSGREDDAVRLLSSRDKKRRYRVEAQRDEDLDVSDRWQGSP